MTEWFEIGQKVVCINDQWSEGLWMGVRPPPCPLVAEQVYQINAVELNDYSNSFSPVGCGKRALNLTIVRLVGVHNPCGVRDFFCASRFKPLPPRDVPAFTQERNEVTA